MSAFAALRRAAADQDTGRFLILGLGASLAWLGLVLLLAWLGPGDDPDSGWWLLWLAGVLVPLALIWFAVWSVRGLARLRREADDLRATLAQMQNTSDTPQAGPREDASRPQPVSRMTMRPSAASLRMPPPPPPPPAETDQAGLDLGISPTPQLTAAELALALNFPDGPDDREAIRCLHLALSAPALARLIRAAQDVVTLLAGQGVYMDDLSVPDTDPRLWHRFAEGERGEAVAGLAVIGNAPALAAATGLLRSDAVFRDVAHHFLRQFDKLLGQRARQDGDALLAVLAETRSGRAFLLLAQATGMLGSGPVAEGP